jgi:hypothetical protein
MVQLTSHEYLKAAIYERSAVLFGKYVHEVLQEFYAAPVYRKLHLSEFGSSSF